MLKDVFTIDSYQSFFVKGSWFDMNENLQGVLNVMINLLFGFIKYLVLALDYTIEKLFHLNLLSDVLPTLFSTAGAIYNRLFDILGILVFTAVIILMIHDFLSRGFAKALARLCVFLLIYFGSLAFFQDGATKIQEVNTLSQSLQGQLVDLTSGSLSESTSSTSDKLLGDTSHLDGTATIRNVIFDEFVLKPYALLNFGKTTISADQFEAYLIKNGEPYTDDTVKEIQKKIKEDAKENSYLTSDRMTEKGMVLINTLIMLFVIGTAVLIIGIANILIQLLLYGLIFLFPSLLFLALIPNFHHLLKNGFLLLGTLFAGKVGLGFAFGLLFSILNIIDSFFVVTNIVTMLVGLFVKVLLGILIWKNKGSILHLLTKGKANLRDLTLNPRHAWQNQKQQQAEKTVQQNRYEEQTYKTATAENDYLRSSAELERLYRLNELEDNTLLQAGKIENESISESDTEISSLASHEREENSVDEIDTSIDEPTSSSIDSETEEYPILETGTVPQEEIDDYLDQETVEIESVSFTHTEEEHSLLSTPATEKTVPITHWAENDDSNESELSTPEAEKLMDEIASLRHERNERVVYE